MPTNLVFDELLLSINDIIETVCINLRNITSLEPAILCYGIFRCCRVVQVSLLSLTRCQHERSDVIAEGKINLHDSGAP